MILELDFLLQSIGIIGIIIFYIVLAKLSARMGEGLMLAPYYLWYYVAIIITLLTIPIHVYLHQKYEMPHSIEATLDLQGLYVSLLLISNVIAITVSFRYWWWLKDEIFNRSL